MEAFENNIPLVGLVPKPKSPTTAKPKWFLDFEKKVNNFIDEQKQFNTKVSYFIEKQIEFNGKMLEFKDDMLGFKDFVIIQFKKHKWI